MAKRGFEVETAESADEGLARIGSESFDVIAIDNHMPGKSGRQMLDEIIAQDQHPPVVFVTGNDDTAVAVEAMHAGASDFVVKITGEGFFDLLAGRFRQAILRDRLEREKRQAEDDLRDANERLEMLMREVHHRVANSLQMVQSFVALQANQTEEPVAREALAATQNRIKAVGKVHQNLYTRDDLTTIDLDEYLGSLVDDLRSNLPETSGTITLTYQSEHVEVSPDDAVSVGVVVNELVSNAAKYAFPSGQSGTITVELETCAGGFALIISDDGAGMGADEAPQGTGLGMRIVSAITRSLGTEVEHMECSSGTRLRMVVRSAG